MTYRLTMDLSPSQQAGVSEILKEASGLPKPYVAYLLATAYHETGRTFQPVRETFAKDDDTAINILENSFQKGRMPWVTRPYWRKDSQGKSWLGRGFVQLTHKANYLKASKELRVDLLSDPDKAMDPSIAAKILVKGSLGGWFTRKKLSDYLDQDPPDYYNARRIINSVESAQRVARYAKMFEDALVWEAPKFSLIEWLVKLLTGIIK